MSRRKTSGPEPRCTNCRHWETGEYVDGSWWRTERLDCHTPTQDIGHCKAISVPGSNGSYGHEDNSAPLAVAVDSESCTCDFTTDAQFGCILFDARLSLKGELP